jgi:hypothetical protein
MYVSRRIADAAGVPPVEFGGAAGAAAAAAAGAGAGGGESHAEIVRSVRETLASYDDPTVMFALQKELAIKEERFEDARWAGMGSGGAGAGRGAALCWGALQ